jgi:uncharacterized protein (DUF2267 family)
MTDFTEADVYRAAEVLEAEYGPDKGTRAMNERDARAVLTAVVPAMRDRWQAEALLEAADTLTVIADTEQGDAKGALLGAAALLRARADAIEMFARRGRLAPSSSNERIRNERSSSV